MKQGLIKYLSFAVFSCTLVSSLNTQCLDKSANLPGQIGWLLPATLVYTLMSATKKVVGYVGGEKSPTAPIDPAVIPVSEFSGPVTPAISTSQISEGISEFFKDKYELGLKKGGEFVEAFNNASPMRAGYFVWRHKGKIALTLGALALYKKYRESDNNKRVININNSRVIINKA